jgi:hypothetical protein
MVSFKVSGFVDLGDVSSDDEDENYETAKSHSKKKAHSNSKYQYLLYISLTIYNRLHLCL